MNRAKNELLQFLGGLLMLVAGLFIFSQKVMVSSTFFGLRMMLGGMSMSNGMIIIPLIIGIVWMFASGGSFASKIFTSLGVLIIVVSIILTTNISLVRMTLYEWVLILILIFGGAGMLARILFTGSKSVTADSDGINRLDGHILNENRKIREIEKEIEQIKKEK